MRQLLYLAVNTELEEPVLGLHGVSGLARAEIQRLKYCSNFKVHGGRVSRAAVTEPQTGQFETRKLLETRRLRSRCP